MKHLAILFLFISCTLSLSARETGIAKSHDINLWYETFGKKEDSALLLIMGGGGQGILWPASFCEKLANEGFYVIRYDHRDAGFSTHLDYTENPYDVSDMANDAIGLLDSLNIKQAHLVGLSMGGPIAEIMAGRQPKRILSLTLMMSSCDFRPLNRALKKLPIEREFLARPSQNYLVMIDDIFARTPTTEEEKIAQRIACWQLLNGSIVPLNIEEQKEIHSLFLSRLQSLQGFANHISCIENSEEWVQSAPYQVRCPTIILHGTEDPIFSPEHGKALAKAIQGSTFILVEGMGHVPNPNFYDIYIESIKQVSSKAK